MRMAKGKKQPRRSSAAMNAVSEEQIPKRAEMSLGLFAERYSLKLRRDECGDVFVGGKSGQVYEYNPARLAVLFLGKTKRNWNAAKKRLAAAGFELKQDCDTEGTATFDPTDAEQCQIAVQVVKAKLRRVLTTAQQTQLRAATEKAALARNRQNHRARGVSGANLRSPDPQTTPRASQEN